jgi:hypothetical protein
MRWARKLLPPIMLRDGRRLSTLYDAKNLIGSLPEERRNAPSWQYAEALLVDAAESGKMEDAQAHLARVLRADGLL